MVYGNASEPEPVRESTSKFKKKEKKAKPQKERQGMGGLLRNKVLWGTLCIIAALLLAFVGVPMAQEKAAALAPVVVLKNDVPIGTQLTREMLAVVEIGASGVPRNAISSISDAAGKYMATIGLADDILTGKRLSDNYPTDDPELLALPEGKVAMAVALDSLEQSVASKLRAGDLIQLFAVMNDTLDATDDLVAMVVPELRAVEVLNVTNNAAVNISDQDDPLDPDEDRQITTVVLAVNQQQAAALAGLTVNAHLHSALVLRGSETGKAALLAAQEEYFSSLKVEDPDEPGTEAEDSGQAGAEVATGPEGEEDT